MVAFMGKSDVKVSKCFLFIHISSPSVSMNVEGRLTHLLEHYLLGRQGMHLLVDFCCSVYHVFKCSFLAKKHRQLSFC